MEMRKTEEGISGEFSMKELDWMRPIIIPMKAVAMAVTTTKDDAELGKWFRLLSEAVLLDRSKQLNHDWLLLSAMLASAGIKESEAISAFLMAADESGILKVRGRDQKKVFKTIMEHPNALRVDQLTCMWDEVVSELETN